MRADRTLFFMVRRRTERGTLNSHQELCMNPSLVRRGVVAMVAFSVAGLVVACGGEDRRVKQLNQGISRDSVMTVIGVNPKNAAGPDSFPNVYTREKYLIDGKNYEVLYFSPENRKFVPGDSVQLRTLTPIVLVDNLLAGKGW